MALRPGKKDTGAATVASDPLIEIAGPVPPKDDRIYVDTSNVADLKATCDDAVERVSPTRSSLAHTEIGGPDP